MGNKGVNYVDRKYIDEISPYLKNFHQKSNSLWNCRCVYCNDSKTNKRKSRGYFFVGNDGNVIYTCHNCNVGDGGVSLGNFIKDNFPNLYSQYKLDRLNESRNTRLNFPVVDINKSRRDKIILKLSKVSSSSTKIGELNKTHAAYRYLAERKIPNFEELLIAPDFRQYVAEMTDNDSRYERLKREPRIIIPLKTPEGVIFGFQGRDLSGTSNLKYITIKIDNSYPKIYGLERFQKDKAGFIVEGPFDSMFLPNCVAMCGSNFDFSSIDRGLIIPENVIVVYDNESRNKEIVNRMSKMIDVGFRMFIPPKSLDTKLKDINQMVLSGTSPEELVRMFVTNSYTGVKAKLALNNWKKVI